MASQVEICNRALIRLGADTITDITENTKEARLCNVIYDAVRRDLLRSHPWNFAMKRANLASSTTDPEFQYMYAYTLPSDCLRVWDVYFTTFPYKIEGRTLVTDDNACYLIYISDEDDTEIFDSAFTSLLSIKLAMEMCYNITGQSTMVSVLQDEFNRIKREAKQFDGQEGSPATWDDTGSWLDSRD